MRRRSSRSRLYRPSSRLNRCRTRSSISRLVELSESMLPRTTTGFSLAAAGKSHSWLTATTESPRPRAKAVSVALGRRVQIRIFQS